MTNRVEIEALLSPVDRLYSEIVRFVSLEPAQIQFRSDLSGLLVVSMAAAYENCVKEILISYCASHSPAFGVYAENQYEKLNSKVSSGDFVAYCGLFGVECKERYKNILNNRRGNIQERTGKDILVMYDQILRWRHQYAHARQQNTTVEEAYAHHKFGKRMLFVLAKALS